MNFLFQLLYMSTLEFSFGSLKNNNFYLLTDIHYIKNITILILSFISLDMVF